MAQKKVAFGILFLFGLSLLEGLYVRPTHASHDEAKHQKNAKQTQDLDWIDELASAIGSKKEWQGRTSCSIIQKHIKDDEAIIKKLSEQLNRAGSGVGGMVSAGIDKVSLEGAKAQLAYHQKILKALEGLSENKNDRERVVKHLSVLYKNNEHLHQLQCAYDSAQGAEKAKAWFALNLQKLKVKSKKAYISAMLLKNGFEA